ncbi:MAG: ice-binding family protein [Balneolaceae bacterium]
MNTINQQKPADKWKRFWSFSMCTILLIGMFMIGCDDDSPGGVGDTDAPVVLSTQPEDNAEDVPVNTTVSATFSEDMNAASLNDSSFMLTENGSAITGVVTLTERTATFTANTELNTDTEYVATITTEAESEANVSLEDDYEWSFTTSASMNDTTGTDTTGTDTTGVALQEPLDLGSTSGFAIISRTGISHSGESEINGDIGISPGTSNDISGFQLTPDTTGEFATTSGVNGNIYAADYLGTTPDILLQAEEDLIAAYDNSWVETRGTATTLSGDLSGQTLTPGLYEADAAELSNNGLLTLDAEGNENAVFIVRSSSLTTGPGSEIQLTGNAQPENIYWVSDSDVSLGEESRMSGTVLSGGGIIMNAGSQIDGRLFLQGENASEVSLNNNIINASGVEKPTMGYNIK